MKTPEEIAREIVDRKTIDPGFVGPGDVSCPKGGLIAAIAAAISAERSAGTSPNDRLVTPKLAVAARSAPAPVRPPAVRVPTPEEIAAMPLEQVAAETARLKRETGAVGGISRCEPAPACARCGGAEVLPCPHLREECQRLRHEAKHEPCPECRGTP